MNADELELIEELGRGAYGVVDKMKHVPSGIIMAVKVGGSSGHLICRMHRALFLKIAP